MLCTTERCRRELEGFCKQTDYLDWPAVRGLIEHRQGPAVWYLLNFALWWKRFVSGERAA